VRFLAGKDIFLFLPSVHGGSGTTLASYPVGTGGSSPGLKRLGRETDHFNPVPKLRMMGVVLSLRPCAVAEC